MASDDLQLAQSLLAGTPEAFDRFVDLYHTKLFHYSYLMCGHREDAEEVSQETLLNVFKNLRQLQSPEHLKAWVFRIAKNACLMKRRKSAFAPNRELSLDGLPPSRDGSAIHRLQIPNLAARPDLELLRLDFAARSMMP